MLSGKQLKYYASLSQKKYRQEHSRFLAEGEKLVEDLLKPGNNFLKSLVLLALPGVFSKIELQFSGIKRIEVDESDLRKISSLQTPNRAILELEIPVYKFNPEKSSKGLSLYFEDLRDPGNMGTILRIADWFGIPDVFCSPESVEVFNPKVVQASMGSIGRVRMHYIDIKDFNTKMKHANPQFRLLGTTMHGKSLYNEIIPESCCFVFGNESKGMTRDALVLCDEILTIPSFGASGAESLNVAVASGIFCTEARRQRLIQSGSKG